MDDDLSVLGLKVKDETRFDGDTGNAVKERVYTFKLGKNHGPFTVRLPPDADPSVFNQKVIALRAHIQALTK